MTQLAPLRTQLNRLRRRRACVRWGTAWSSLLLGGLWAIALAFLVDWSFQMSRPQRLVSLLLWLAASAWIFRRFTLPWLGWKESETDMALLVERQHRIDSDLVAALQFETTQARQWGSPQLEKAVVNSVEQCSRKLNVFEGFSSRQMTRRLMLTAGTLLLMGGGMLLFPAHLKAFFNRFLLGSAHYPTRTIIERIRLNGVEIFPAGDRTSVFRSPYGKPLAFEVECSGELPQAGLVRLRSLRNNARAEFELQPTNGAHSPGTNQPYAGQLPRLVDAVAYQLYLGDARTDPREVQVLPLPVVNVDLTPHPPRYAAAGRDSGPDAAAGALQLEVVEGSYVDLRVNCGNKDLKSATLLIGENDYPLSPLDGSHREWRLPRSGSPLVRIREPVRFVIQVEDIDGLGLEIPIQGDIRIKSDRPPRVAAAMVSRQVLPAARPRITYGATDDYGLSKLLVHVQVVRSAGRDGDSQAESREMKAEVREIATIPAEEQPRTVVRGEQALDLQSLDLAKGDELKVTLEAFDYRGDQEPRSTVSEPLVLQVTDREGILTGLLESDEKSARQLDTIIERELGIGEMP